MHYDEQREQSIDEEYLRRENIADEALKDVIDNYSVEDKEILVDIARDILSIKQTLKVFARIIK